MIKYSYFLILEETKKRLNDSFRVVQSTHWGIILGQKEQ